MLLKTVCGIEFEIDDEDYELIKDFAYHYVPSKTGPGYIKLYKNKISCWLHKFLLGLNPLELGDHINGNSLNNRRSNLRKASRAQQNQNRRNWGKLPKGITFDPNKKLYRARIQIDGIRIGLGRFKKLEDAVDAYNKYARKFYGANAILSYIK